MHLSSIQLSNLMTVIATYFLPVWLTFSERHRQTDRPDALPRGATFFMPIKWFLHYKHISKNITLLMTIFLKPINTYTVHYPGVTSNKSEKWQWNCNDLQRNKGMNFILLNIRAQISLYNFFHCCTVHSDIYTVHWLTNALL
jgi:hypothetical protein